MQVGEEAQYLLWSARGPRSKAAGASEPCRASLGGCSLSSSSVANPEPA